MAMPVDLRSDTVTLPTDEMRRAMAGADLGDDVYGEDPTVNRLQEMAAALTGKEAALLVPSGTMGNLIGLLVSAPRGSEVIADADSHVFLYETAGAAVAGGIQLRPLATRSGVMAAGDIEAAVRPTDDAHQPLTAAITIEDTHNRHGGTVWGLADLRAARSVASRHGLRVHLDGARLFNAAAALRVPAREIADEADTLSFCLSKALCCPVGSVFCGSAEDVAEAHRLRKLLGGGMRQAGVLAAAGIVALESMVDRLPEDHSHARVLAEGLAEMDGLTVDLDRVQTNIVIAEPERIGAPEFVERLRVRGVLAGTMGPRTVRFVTHHGISAAGVQTALAAAQSALGAATG